MATALRACRGYKLAAGGFSLAFNLLYLASPLYMLQVYNRGVTSGSQITLVLLTVALLLAFAALASLDFIRLRILARMGLRLEQTLAEPVFLATFNSQGGARSQLPRFRCVPAVRIFGNAILLEIVRRSGPAMVWYPALATSPTVPLGPVRRSDDVARG